MSQYENPTELFVSFEAPENTRVVLQGPALEAYYAYLDSGDDADFEDFEDKLLDQLETHITAWTRIGDWDVAPQRLTAPPVETD